MKKRKPGKPVIYTKEVFEFMKKCADKGLTINETREKCELEFEHPFSLDTLKMVAGKKRIHFVGRRLGFNFDDINKEKLALIKKYKHLKNWIIRDKLIEKFGEGMITTEINKIVRKLEVDELNKKENK